MEQKLEAIMYNPLVGKIITVIIGIIIVWTVRKILRKRFFNKIKDNEHRYTAKKISAFLGYLIILIVIIIVFSDQLGDFSMAVGLAGAGIAFALQEVIASFAGWMAIMFGGFYKTGDRVQLGGIKGDVMDIGMLRTTIMETGQWVDGDLYNGRIVLIANSFIFKEPVFNYSGDFPFLWDEIKVPIQFGSDYAMVSKMLLRVGKEVAGDLSSLSKDKWHEMQNKYRLEDAQTEAMVSLVANDNWVEYTLRYVVTYRKRRATKTELFTKILTEVDASGGKMRLASATFQLVEAPDFNVRMKN